MGVVLNLLMSSVASGFTGNNRINARRRSQTSSRIRIWEEKLVIVLVMVVVAPAFQGEVSPGVAGQGLDASPPAPDLPSPLLNGTAALAPGPGLPPMVLNGPSPAPVGPLPRSSAPSPPAPPPPAASQPVQFKQLIASLRYNGFTTAAEFLAEYLFFLPLDSTLFVPSNAAFIGVVSSPVLTYILSYHAVPKQLSYSQVVQLPVDTRLTTMVANNTILVTNAGNLNFRLDNVQLIEGNVCSSTVLPPLQITCHGIAAILNITAWGVARGSQVAPGSPVTAPDSTPILGSPTPALTPLSPNPNPTSGPAPTRFPSTGQDPDADPEDFPADEGSSPTERPLSFSVLAFLSFVATVALVV